DGFLLLLTSLHCWNSLSQIFRTNFEAFSAEFKNGSCRFLLAVCRVCGCCRSIAAVAGIRATSLYKLRTLAFFVLFPAQNFLACALEVNFGDSHCWSAPGTSLERLHIIAVLGISWPTRRLTAASPCSLLKTGSSNRS